MNKPLIRFILLQLITEHPFSHVTDIVFSPKTPTKCIQCTAKCFTLFPRADFHLNHSRLCQDQKYNFKYFFIPPNLVGLLVTNKVIIYFDMLNDMIYLLTAIWLSPGGRSTVHINTQTIHRTIQSEQYIEQHNNFGRVRAVPRLG